MLGAFIFGVIVGVVVGIIANIYAMAQMKLPPEGMVYGGSFNTKVIMKECELVNLTELEKARINRGYFYRLKISSLDK